MEKKFIGDVYTITGIDSTSQLKAFFKEVVEKNIEKYVGITVQGIKFKLDNSGEKALQLLPNEEYAVNPHYRKIEVTPTEELVEEVETASVETVEELIEQDEEVIQQEIDVEQPTESKECDNCTQLALQLEEHEKTIEANNNTIDELKVELAQQTELCSKLSSENNLNKERAEQAELIVEQQKERINELQNELEQCSVEQQAEPTTLESLLYQLKELGYTAYVTKIW